MKDLIYRDWAYICLILILVLASVYVVTTFNHGFFTAVDEGYFLIKLKEAYEGGIITGKSQWNLIAIHWFPYLDLTSKANSYLASCILRWFTILVFTITCCVKFRKDRVFRYFAIFLLAYFSCGQDFGLSYIPMQTCILCWALCSYLLFQYYQNRIVKAFYILTCGFCLGISGFIVITGTIALTPLFVVMIIANSKNDKALIALNLLYLLGGFILALTYVNFMVCPLIDIIDAMVETAQYFSKNGHNYDGISFLRQYVKFLCELSHMIIYIVGAFYLSSLCKNKIVSLMVYTLAILFYFILSPIMGGETVYILTICFVAIPLLFRNNISEVFSNLSEEKLLYCFLFLFPILAPLGTNCPLEVRMNNYIASWLFIFFSYEYKMEYRDFKILIVPLILLLIWPICNLIKGNLNYDNRFHFTQGYGHFSEISLSSKQAQYFNNINNIIKDYGYQPRKSVLFTTMYDYATLYAIDAVNSSNFYHTENFQFFDKSKMLAPDFIILCPYDSTLIGKELQAMPWGWPNEFDSYDIGSPESITYGLPDYILDNRKLYCRRTLKVNR